MSVHITPDKARELLDGTTPGPWHVHTRDRHIDGETETWLYVGDTPALSVDHQLMSAAPELAELVAGLRYEYLVAVGPEHSPVYATMNSQGRFVGTTLPLADRWATKGEAQSLVDELREGNENSTARVVRRLVSEPEVAE